MQLLAWKIWNIDPTFLRQSLKITFWLLCNLSLHLISDFWIMHVRLVNRVSARELVCTGCFNYRYLSLSIAVYHAQRQCVIFPLRLCCLLSCSFSSCRGNGFCSANSACVLFDNWDALRGKKHTHLISSLNSPPLPPGQRELSVHLCRASDCCCTHNNKPTDVY